MPAHVAIERLRAIIKEGKRYELVQFLLAEKGFRIEQVRRTCFSLLQRTIVYNFQVGSNLVDAIHYVAGREFETADEADEWLSYLVVDRNENIDKPGKVQYQYF